MESAATDLDLRAWLDVLWRRRWITFATVAVALVAAGLLNARAQPVYRSTSTVLVQSTSLEGVVARLGYGGATTPNERVLANEIVLVGSDETRAAVAEKLGYSASVTVSSDPDSDVLRFSATAGDPARAAEVVDTYVETFTERRREAAVDEMVKVTELLTTRRAAIDAERDALAADLAQAQLEVDRASTDAERQAATTALEAAEARADVRSDALDAEEAGLDTSLSAVNLVNEFRDGSGVQTVVAATAGSPISTSPVRSFAVAGLGGLLLGIGISLLLEYLDNRVKGKADLERAARGVPVLAMVPPSASATDTSVESIDHPRSSVAESYRNLRTSLQFLALHRDLQILLVTSASSSEAKTTTVSNLGVALARVGKRVVLVDADLRRPRLSQRFAVEGAGGLTSVLLGDREVGDVAKKVPGVPNLVVVPSGPLPPDPSELLASPATSALLRSIADEVDVLIVDSPPLLPVSDSSVLAGIADGVLLVARAGYSQRRHVARAVEVLEQIDAPLIGAVLTGAADDGGSGGYYYGEYYADEVPPDDDAGPIDDGTDARSAGSEGRVPTPAPPTGSG